MIIISMPKLPGLIRLFQDSIEVLEEGFAEPLAASGNLFHEHVSQRFDAQGPGWAPWAPRTVSERTNRIGWYSQPPIEQNKIGIWTGGLFRSMTTRDAPGSIWELSPNQLVVGSSLRYAAPFHGDPPRPSQPPRRLFVEAGLEQAMGDEFASYLKRRVPVFKASVGDPVSINPTPIVL